MKCDAITKDLHELRSDIKNISTINTCIQPTQQLSNELVDNIFQNQNQTTKYEAVQGHYLDFNQLRNRFHTLLSPDTVETTSATDLSERNLPPRPTTNVISNDDGNSQLGKVALIVDAKTRKSLHLLGSSVDSVRLDSHFQLSLFNIDVTPNDIVDYMVANSNFNKDHIRIYRLVKKGQTISSLSYVTFNVETVSDIGTIISQPGYWPHNINIKRWITKSSKNLTSSFLDNRPT